VTGRKTRPKAWKTWWWSWWS